MELLINSAHGIYIGKLLAENYAGYITNKDELAEDIAILLEGPDNEEYIEAWANVEEKAQLENDKGEKFTLCSKEGDLWAIMEGEELPEY